MLTHKIIGLYDTMQDMIKKAFETFADTIELLDVIPASTYINNPDLVLETRLTECDLWKDFNKDDYIKDTENSHFPWEDHPVSGFGLVIILKNSPPDTEPTQLAIVELYFSFLKEEDILHPTLFILNATQDKTKSPLVATLLINTINKTLAFLKTKFNSDISELNIYSAAAIDAALFAILSGEESIGAIPDNLLAPIQPPAIQLDLNSEIKILTNYDTLKGFLDSFVISPRNKQKFLFESLATATTRHQEYFKAKRARNAEDTD